MRNAITQLAVLFVFFATSISGAESKEKSRPNIVLIMADDMGYSDIGCFGGEIKTPNLNQLAEHGVRFTQFYNTGRCCPTRAALLTGLYSHQAGIGHMVDDRRLPAYQGELNKQCVTIAEVMRTAGYKNYMVGKWHVARNSQPDGPKHAWPLQRGFDRFYGTITGAGSFYDPGTLTRDNQAISPENDPDYRPDRYYYTDAISDHAIRFIQDHQKSNASENKKDPFFMYVAFTTAHWPMHAFEEDIAKYKGTYDAGYDAIRQGRVQRLKELGLMAPNWQLTPTVGDWENFDNREWEIRCMEVYAAMIDRMDRGIGRIVAALKEQGCLENTLVLFLQDNGGCAEEIGRQGPGDARPEKPTLPVIPPEQTRPEVFPKQTRDGFPVRAGRTVMPGPPDTYVAYGEGWANVSNTPFRRYKHWQHEGGISTPLIAHWPAGIPESRHGKLESQPGHLIDLLATCADLADAQYPTELNGSQILPMEGVSLVPGFSGEPLNRKAPIFWEHEGNRAVREGKWKLVADGPKGAWELYDMEKDRTEMNDLAASMPEKVADLSAKWQAWADRVGVKPWPVPGPGKKKK